MEDLSRCGRLHNLNVVLGTLRQEPFQAGAGVFRALPFVTMRQQQNQAAESFPLLFGTDDELIDDHLRDIHEVAELGFPQDQARRVIKTIAIFVAHDPDFGERAIDDIDRRLVGRQMLQATVDVPVLNVVPDGLTMAECATTAVLATQANVCLVDGQTRIGEQFGGTPIERFLAVSHFHTRIQDHRLQPRMDMEISRDFNHLLHQRGQLRQRHSRIDIGDFLVGATAIPLPLTTQRIGMWLVVA